MWCPVSARCACQCGTCCTATSLLSACGVGFDVGCCVCACACQCGRLMKCWAARPITTSAARFEESGEFMSKEKFDSMIPEDALKDIDTDVPVIVEGEKHYSERVTKLAEEILTLNLLETSDLCDILKVRCLCGELLWSCRLTASCRVQGRLNMTDDAMFFPMPNLAGMVVAGGGGPAGGAEEEAAPVEAKTHFDLKLVSFDAKAKIKIIKEVRTATKLGLKEVRFAVGLTRLGWWGWLALLTTAVAALTMCLLQAKDLVESAPAVLLKDASKDDAEPLKAKLEELGAHMELE